MVVIEIAIIEGKAYKFFFEILLNEALSYLI